MSMSIAEAKSQFSAVVERAAAGEEITITKHGKPVAKLVPVARHDPERTRKVLEKIIELRERSGATLGGLDWKELRDEGRK